jgi:hypothetical protein
MMDKQWLDFIEGRINAVKVETIISREQTKQGTELIHITIDNSDLYQFWHNPNKTKVRDSPPKHTGGKKPYVMLMIEQIETLRKKNISNIEELIGFMACLAGNVQWHTGKLIHKRSKKQLMYADLLKLFSCGKRKLDRILKDLQVNDLMTHSQEGYFVSRELIKKGCGKNE